MARGRMTCAAVAIACAVLGAGATAPVAADEVADPASTGTVEASGAVHGFGETRWGDIDARQLLASLDANGRWAPSRDTGSLFSLISGFGLRSLWSSQATGKGVTVAVIDTGVSPVRGLDAPGKVVNGPDLSFESQRPGTRSVDGYGHGTHMAGIIAANDPGTAADRFTGVAPDAQILNMKVGAADGAADVSQVIAALDWVVANRRANGMNVRVISLSYGTESVQPWQVDPLAHAVENAWRAGIVVVAAAGNDGLDAPSLLMPAVDPKVIAVGAVDPRGTADRKDDVVADFTNGGSAARRPDLLAPGRSIVSLRVPGSYLDTFHPEGRVLGDASGRFFRGSGTSQATAVAAGKVAMLLQKRPTLTPDQVKALLVRTADRLTPARPEMGAGVIDVAEAMRVLLPPLTASASTPASKGTGTLDGARGGEYVIDPANGALLTGEVDALGAPWKAGTWAAASAKRTSWSGAAFNGRTWSGTWTGSSWSGLPWASRAWTDATWRNGAWTGGEWQGRSWRADSWLGRSWRGGSWAGRSWRTR